MLASMLAASWKHCEGQRGQFSSRYFVQGRMDALDVASAEHRKPVTRSMRSIETSSRLAIGPET